MGFRDSEVEQSLILRDCFKPLERRLEIGARLEKLHHTKFLAGCKQFSRRSFLFFAGTALAQEQAIFRTDVKVVNVLATVRTKKGDYIRDLTKDDFTILEDGRPQAISYFGKQSDLPLEIGLLIDTSMSQKRLLNAERGACGKFIDQVMRPQDKFFLLSFDMRVQTRIGLTSSRRELQEALSYVDTPSRKELESNPLTTGTVFYDSILTASDEILKNEQGRKAVIVLTDGVDFGSNFTLANAIESAERADVLVYSILFVDSGFYSGGGPDGRSSLMKLSHETGGGYFQVTKKISIEQIFDQIQDELRSQYSLGYVSDKPVRISEFRKIDVVTSRKDLVVQARKRYYAKR